MKVILARHGDAVGTKGKFHGMVDTPLTSAGVKEAQDLANQLGKYGATQLFSSPLQRTMQTAKIIGDKLKLQVTPNKALLPLNLGDFVGKPTDKYLEQVKQYFASPNVKIPNGETVNQWANRFIPFINKLLYSKSPETVIVVTHGRNIILTEADMKMGNNTNYDKNVLIQAKKSTEHGGYAVADGNANKFEIVTPKSVPAGQS